jgi:hypothetical protein
VPSDRQRQFPTFSKKERRMSFGTALEATGIRGSAACLAFILLLGAIARAEDSTSKNTTTPGNVEFDNADAPAANVELDLSQGMFHDLFGIGDAAVAGVADALAKSSGAQHGAEGAKMAAEQLAAARQIVQIVGQVVQGARVRAYKGIGDQSDKTDKLVAHYDNKLRSENWQSVLRAHEGDQMIDVWAYRNSGAVKGLFIAASDKGNLLLANVVCDISPENVQKLTAAATNSALQAGLAQVIEMKMKSHGPAATKSAIP